MFAEKIFSRSHPALTLFLFSLLDSRLIHSLYSRITMYGFKPLATALALCTLTSAIQVTSPISSTLWSSDTSGQTVSWTAVNTDATSFVIQLVNQVRPSCLKPSAEA